LLRLSRSCVHYLPRPVSASDLAIMRRIDEFHLDFPFAGSRMLRDFLRAAGVDPKDSAEQQDRPGSCHPPEAPHGRRGAVPEHVEADSGHKIYPYLLPGLAVERPNQVRAMDISYIPMARGFVYLAVLDWWSRRALSLQVSITTDADFCLDVAEEVNPVGSVSGGAGRN
jgi:putative transposase